MKATTAVAMVMVMAMWGLALGCGGAAVQLHPDQVLAQMEKNKTEENGRQRLLEQPIRTAPADYRDYAVGPEDLLEIQILGQKDLDRQVRVNGEGEITAPLVGAVKVAGLSPKAIEQRLAELYAPD